MITDDITCSCFGTSDDNCLRCGVALQPAPWRQPRTTAAEVETAPEIPAPRAVEALMDDPPLPCFLPPVPRRRVGPRLALACALAALALGITAAVRTSDAYHPEPVDIGLGVVTCNGAALEKHDVQGFIAYACPRGGEFFCTSPRCRVYPWEYVEDTRRWRVVRRGDNLALPPGMDHFFVGVAP